MRLKDVIVPFKSTPENFLKEEDGTKSNTIRKIDFLDERFISLALMHNKKEYGRIEITNTETGKKILRRITDITLWELSLLISWRHQE